MYCNSCGHLNDDSMNYCTNDGAKLHLVNSKNASLSKEESNFCSLCGAAEQGLSNYCNTCGKSQLKFSNKKDFVAQSTGAVLNSLNKLPKTKKASFAVSLSTTKIKTALFGTLLSFIILIALSALINHYAVEQVNEFLESEEVSDFSINGVFEQISDVADIPKPDPFVGVTDYMLLSHMVDSEVNGTVKGESFDQEIDYKVSVETSTGWFIMLLVPFMALVVGGFFYGKKNPNDTVTERLSAAAVMGLGYGILLALTTLFGGFSYDAKVSEDYAKLVFEIDNNYSFLGALFNGFVFGTLFAGMGVLIKRGSLRTTGHLSRYFSTGESVHQAVGTFFRGVLVMIAIVFIYIYLEEKDTDNLELSLIFAISAQIGMYLWNILHLPSFMVDLTAGGDSISLKYSLVGGFNEKASDSDMIRSANDFFQEVIDIEKILYYSIILMIILFVYAGYRIAMKSGDNIKHIAVFSLTYSLIMAFFVSITKLGVAISADEEFGFIDNGEVFVGFSVLTTFLLSLFVSSVLAYGGSYLAKYKQS